MSRVFEALRRSESESKVVAPLGSTANAEPEAKEIAPSGLDWDRMPIVQAHPDRVSRIVTIDDPTSLAAEKFRVLAAQLRHKQQERPALSTLVITSSGAGEGKSTVAANLAVALASRSTGRVLLVDGDLRLPRQGAMWGLGRPAGLGDCLQFNKPVEDVLFNVENLRVCLLTAGSATDHPPDLLQSPRLKGLIDQLRASFAWVIIDAPPVLPLADMNLIARCTDGALLVARQDRTVKKDLKQAVSALGNTKIIGVVLNAAELKENNYYYSRYAGAAGHKKSQL